jgi:hypothetical protein
VAITQVWLILVGDGAAAATDSFAPASELDRGCMACRGRFLMDNNTQLAIEVTRREACGT